MAETFRAAARGVSPGERDILLRTVIAAVPEMVSGVVSVSLTCWDGGRFQTVAASDRVAVRLDEWQYAADRGPCVDAARQGRRTLISDLTDTGQGFAAAAGSTKVRSVLSIPLPQPADHAGLNCYAAGSATIAGGLAEARLDLFGRTAAALLGGHPSETVPTGARLEAALARRRELERACARLAKRDGITVDEALRALSAGAIHRGVTMTAVARELLRRDADE
ncbi:ANTAR domain-containing protein [Amycolatopsis sp. DSM 110486]|uniref:ANTAR domain-containing protein n=1 Tax=Amycolatopsis sp. DSM 110486 TaxID=2865832 RepID=UPI001C6A411D|nr:ANTAR domain-containing protein [Amycolatopsis sp. DSM 110486]QYN19100.1 ANTAR domain-containing protein [Amycolatopsis sp. DSM 110486]